MSVPTANRRTVPARSVIGLVAHHPVAAFLIMVYAIAWPVLLPVILQGRGLLALPTDFSEGLAFNAVVSIATISASRYPLSL